MKNLKTIIFPLFAVTLMVACSSEDLDKGKDKQKEDLVTFQGGAPLARSSMAHVQGGEGYFFWENGDKIWVDAGAGVFFQNTSSSITNKSSRADFYFPAGKLIDTAYPVFYTGNTSSSATSVTIRSAQTQTSPDNTSHIGTSGDCGWATATKNSLGIYQFQLEHMASYLCLLPRTAAPGFQKCKLMKIELIADKTIAGTYDFSAAGLSTTPTSGASSTITLTTGASGFPLTNPATNGAYIVIAPGTYAFVIKYWLKDPDSGTEGVITKSLASAQYEANKVYDITANFDTRACANDSYYTWDADAGQHYWKGHESAQPTIYNAHSDEYPKNSSDPRWYNPVAAPGVATRSCAKCPSVNECCWLLQYGNPLWETTDELWTAFGKLYKGGYWFKKLSTIAREQHKTLDELKNAAPNGTNYILSGNPTSYNIHGPSSGRPSDADIADYFYLPSGGEYLTGTFFGDMGVYWTSSTDTTYPNCSYTFAFERNFWIQLTSGERTANGLRLWTGE